MLVHLSISNLAVIAEAELGFGPGLNVLTGETGAGKSIVVGALSLVLGDRARSDTVRHGAKNAQVQALFRLSPDHEASGRLKALDLIDEPVGELGDEPVELIVRRIVGANGRGRVYINGVLSTVGTLKSVTQGLVDISSQHQHTALIGSDTHLDVVDRYGQLGELLNAYGASYRALAAARQSLADLEGQEKERIEREDFVRFQLEEIRDVQPESGETERLSQQRERLMHADRLVRGSSSAEDLAAGDRGSAAHALAEATQVVERLAEVDDALTALAERLSTVRIEVEDIAYDLARYRSGIDADPRRLEEVEDRLDALRRLERKHGGSLDIALERAQSLEAELSAFDSLEIRIKETQAVVDDCLARAKADAQRLSSARRSAAEAMGSRVTDELQSLAMGQSQVAVHLEASEQLGPRGQDRAEMLIQTNVGEPLKSLSRVASGGELSRLLLGLKRALIRIDPVSTCVFDEVDTGVGGAVAEVIGRKLAEIAHGDRRQVVAITHLPQIAAFAEHHLVVVKHQGDERVATTVVSLTTSQRVEELARMLGGVDITDTTRAHAAELLRLGSQVGSTTPASIEA